MSAAAPAPHPPDVSRWIRLDAWVQRHVRLPRPRGAIDAELAGALRIFAASTRTGMPLRIAFERAAARVAEPVRSACSAAAADMSMGRGAEDAVARFALALGTPSARLFAQVVQVQHRRGGGLADPCHRLAGLLQERARLEAEARSATAQARFSARAVIAIPVLMAVLAAWRSPDVAQSMLRPMALLLASPGLIAIVLGAWVATRIARRAADVGDVTATAASGGDRLRRRLWRLAGGVPGSRASARLAGVGAIAALPTVAMAGASPTSLVGLVVLPLVGAAWPIADRRRSSARHADIAAAGVDLVLEVSIALFAAGATAQEVAAAVPHAAPEPLRTALLPAAHRMRLGRGIASAFADIPEVVASPQLDGWLHAVCTSAELGTPAISVLEGLLRDARVLRREQLRAAAQTAGPRMQLALVLLVVPGVMWIMLLATVGGLVGQLRGNGVL
ncbi:MAG: type secretion system protein [Thermoleophilia bacterium]|nr:type secretion system protein [Thermoleophilia bacterium]